MYMFNNLKRNGYYPDLIIDVGASNGAWSREVRLVYPDATFWLFEPNKSYTITDFKHVFHMAVAGDTLYVPDRWQHASMIPLPHSKKIIVPYITLDELDLRPYKHIILKIDTQGTELDVLCSGENQLEQIDLIYMEVSLVQLMPNATIPLFHDIVKFLSERGFLLYDINERHVAENGRAMQMDVTFVNTNSRLYDISNIRWEYNQ